MRNFWLVARQEYRRIVVRRGFLVLTLAIPVGLAAVVALVILVETSGKSKLPVGYVDRSGRLDAALFATLPEAAERVGVRPFPDENTAIAALEAEQIQAFFVIPELYPKTLETDLYYLRKPPSGDAWGDFDDFVRLNLLSDLPEPVQQRLLTGSSVTVKDISSNREFSEQAIVNVILPFVASFFFFFATMASAGYMLEVVASEKENRTMEVMLTSLTPGQLIGGKTLGLLAASLTQLSIYLLAAVVGILVARPYVPELQVAAVPWSYLGVMALFFIPAYALIGAMMVSIGAAVTDLQQGQQMAGLLNLLFVLPMMLVVVFLENPNHPLAIFLTLFPTTSFLTVSLRWGLGSIPTWQLALGWVLLVASAVLMVWVAARVFRAGMLRYGQPLNLKAALAAVRGG